MRGREGGRGGWADEQGRGKDVGWQQKNSLPKACYGGRGVKGRGECGGRVFGRLLGTPAMWAVVALAIV